jgi:nitrite reductase (NADH) large subunit
MRHVIVGAGAAGMAAARAIRKLDDRAEIVVVSDEPFPPYRRYLLTEYLCRVIGDDGILQCGEDLLRELDIKLRKGERVTRIHPEQKAVRLEHDQLLSYDRLLIATGRCPNLGPVLQSFRKCIQTYYTMEDAKILQKCLQGVQRVVVTGTGVSRLDLIGGLLRLGKSVTYILRGPKVEVPFLDPASESTVDAALVRRGVEIVRCDRIASIAPLARGYRVKTQQGREYEADLVFAAQSHEPNLACAREVGIEAKSGILVDLCMRTTLPDVYAAGDCVEIYHPGLRNYWINFGWPNAVQQGTVAGHNMAGHHEEYRINETLVFNLLGKPVTARWWN